jgi:hypothetical protein
MKEPCSLIWTALIGFFRTRSSLAVEILVLRHQINVLRRHSPKRQTFSSADRLIFTWLYRLVPTVLNALAIVKPDTVMLMTKRQDLCLQRRSRPEQSDQRQPN